MHLGSDYGSYYNSPHVSPIVIFRSRLFCFFHLTFLRYPIRQVGKDKVFGFLQNHILKFTKIQV